ncbi:MAG: DUF4136 domain-containing protein [Verrucomicrobiota bacterium]
MKLVIRHVICVFSGALLVFALGCQTPSTVDYDAAAITKMQTYSTYQIQPRAQRLEYQEVALSPIVDRRIEAALRTALGSRGYSEVKTAPDFVITFNTLTKTKTEVQDYGGLSGGFRRHPYYGYSGLSRIDIDQYEEGTFIIDIIDGPSNQLVWRGAYQQRLGWSAPDDAEVQLIISKILAEFPPGVAPEPE